MMAYAFRAFSPTWRIPLNRAGLLLMRPVEHWDFLICRVATSRDRAAFQELFQHFAPRVKSYLMRLGVDTQAADDLAQECLLALWRKAELFDPAKASATTWLFTIARNLRIDALRRDRLPMSEGMEASLEPQGEPDPGEELCARERDDALRQALHTLPPEQHQIVTLSFFSDKAHGEIASELGIPLGTVKSRLRLAMTRLRAVLGEEP